MPEHLSESAIRRLEQLAQLKERGVLSDGEFEDAKRAVLSGEALGGRDVAHEVSSRWPVFAMLGLGVLLLIFGIAFWSRPNSSDALSGDVNMVEANFVEPEAETELLSDLCGSESTYDGIKDIVFDEAIKAFGGPGPLNSLRRAVRLRMEVPTVSNIDEKLNRVDCTGRAVIDLPPGVREQFGGDRALEAELEYSIQPAADKSGSVLRVEGIGNVIQRLVGAATLVRSSEIATQGGPQLQKTYNPSFDCGKALSNVERMICQDETLASYDRALSDRYFQLKSGVSATEWQIILRSQREFLAQRAQCPDANCVRSAYVQQARYLDQLSPAD